MRGGRALFAAFRAPTPLERLLACVRVALGLLADALRSSSDPQDAPVVTLGHHYVSCRDVAPEGGCLTCVCHWREEQKQKISGLLQIPVVDSEAIQVASLKLGITVQPRSPLFMILFRGDDVWE
jgi:hypothetical protein